MRLELHLRRLGALFAFAFGVLLLAMASFRHSIAHGARVMLIGYGVGLLAVSVVVWLTAKRYPFLDK